MFGFLYWSSDFLIFLSYLALWFSFISSSLSFCSVFWEFPWLSHFTLEFLLLLICRSTLLVSNGPFSCILSLVMDAVSNTSFLLSSVFLFFCLWISICPCLVSFCQLEALLPCLWQWSDLGRISSTNSIAVFLPVARVCSLPSLASLESILRSLLSKQLSCQAPTLVQTGPSGPACWRANRDGRTEPSDPYLLGSALVDRLHSLAAHCFLLCAPRCPCICQSQTILTLSFSSHSVSFSSKTLLLHSISCSVNVPLSGAHSHQHIQTAPESSSLKAEPRWLPWAHTPSYYSFTSLLLLRQKLPEGVSLVYSLSFITSQSLPFSVCRLLVSRLRWPQLTTVSVSLLLPAQQHRCSDQSWFSPAAPSHCPCWLLHQQCPSSSVPSWAPGSALRLPTVSVPLPGTAVLGIAEVPSLGSLLPLSPLYSSASWS